MGLLHRCARLRGVIRCKKKIIWAGKGVGVKISGFWEKIAKKFKMLAKNSQILMGIFTPQIFQGRGGALLILRFFYIPAPSPPCAHQWFSKIKWTFLKNLLSMSTDEDIDWSVKIYAELMLNFCIFYNLVTTTYIVTVWYPWSILYALQGWLNLAKIIFDKTKPVSICFKALPE